MPPLHPHSDYSRFNLPTTDPAAPLDLEPITIHDVPALLGRMSTEGELLSAGDSGAFVGPRAYRYTGRNQQGVDAAVNHFQGLQRLARDRAAYLALTGSESTEVVPHVFIVKMGTRPALGAWGSNLRFRGDPAPDDGIVRVIALEEGRRWHAGGLGLLGDVLAVPLEGDGTSAVKFLHVADPENPTLLPLTIERPDLAKAGAAALGKLPGGRFICIVWREEGKVKPVGRLDFYVSAGKNLRDGFGTRVTIPFAPDPVLGATRDPQYQSITLIHPAAGAKPTFYLLGTENSAPDAPFGNGSNVVDLYELKVPTSFVSKGAAGAVPKVGWICSREVHAPRAYCNLDAAGGAYVDASGAEPRLFVYGAFHYRMNEHIHLAEFYGRPDRATALTDITDGWIELCEDRDFGGRRLVIHADRESTIPDYSRIYVQDGDFNRKVSSVRWQLPTGFVYRLYKEGDFRGTKPNVDFLDLTGSGTMASIADLSAKKFGDAVMSSRFDVKP